MSTKFKKFDLGISGIEYLKQALLDGLSLCQLVYKHVPLECGKVTTFLPLEISQKEAEDYESGGKILTPPNQRKTVVDKNGNKWIMEPVLNNLSLILPEIQSYLLKNDKRVFVFENALSNAKDPGLTTRKSELWFYGDEVYHAVSLKQGSLSSTQIAIQEAASYRLVGIGTCFLKSGDSAVRRIISEKDLEVLARNAEVIIFHAYDGEGYLIWRLKKTE